MEIFNRIIKGKIDTSSFKFHWLCKSQRITPLCFANNLFLFAHGDVNSILCVVDALDDFIALTGLKFNPDKCHIFFSRLSEDEKLLIPDHTPFSTGTPGTLVYHLLRKGSRMLIARV